MSSRNIFIYIFFTCALLLGIQPLYAQSSRADSIAEANRKLEFSRDSAAKARDAFAEASRKRMEFVRDSMADAREKETQLRQAQAEASRIRMEFVRDSTADAREKETQLRLEQAEAYRKRMEFMRDSAATAREEAAEARRVVAEAAREAREARQDSLRWARKDRADSLAFIRRYKESKYYKDSVASVRKERIDSIAAIRKAHFDSVKTVRQHNIDSTKLARKTVMDSIHAVQKTRSDSFARIRKYKESKRYADSVVVVKKLRTDSVKLVRKGRSDSLIASRKKVTDSFARVRKAKTDSLAGVRKTRTDSMTVNKKVKTDSLAKAKEKRAKNQKVKEQDKEKKQQLAFELKIKKKHQAYSNENMLKKGWGLPRQIVQNSFTRYNYFFNADRKMDEAILNMQRVRKDNYDSLLALFPFDPDRDSAMIAPDMDSIIRKVSVGIQIHDPRTKWGDDLYLILGQAYFYKGNYTDAASAFRYILSLKDKKKKGKSSSDRPKTSKTMSIAQPDKKGALAFLQHRSVNNEAILWLARTFTQMRQEGNAEAVLDLLEVDPNFPKSLQGRLAVEKSFIALHEKDDKTAIDQLTIVAKDGNVPDVIRMRAAFVNGQLQMRRNDYKAASASFTQVIDLYPKIEMDFYARKNLAYSVMLGGGDQKDAVAALKKVLNDGKYSAYYEQVYYVLGRLAASNGDNVAAISYLNKGISSAKATRKQKAISYSALGGIYYKEGDYSSSKTAYDSSVAMAASAPNDSMVLVAVKRSSALNTITGPLGVIHMQDSLLALSAMSQKDQRAEVRRYIRRLEQAKADSAFKAENAAVNNAQSATQSNTGGTNNTNTYANWYFANPALMQSGMNEFKRKWGNRSLGDNWRRSIGSGFGNNTAKNGTPSPDNNEPPSPDIDERGLPTEESLLAYIPSTAEMKDDAIGKTKRAYMDLATAYVKDLEDYPPALHTLDTFDKKFPAHEYQAEALYLRYLTATRQNRLKDAQAFATRLLQEYQDTKWADLVRPTEDGASLDTNQIANVIAYYDETYTLLMQHEYKAVLSRVGQAKKQYNDLTFSKRFTIVEGAALAGNGEYGHADSLLTDFVTSYPSDTLRPWADAILKYIKENKPAVLVPVTAADSAKATKAAGTSGTTSQPAVATATQQGTAPQSGIAPQQAPTMSLEPPKANDYVYNPGEAHFVAFIFGSMEQRTMGLKAGLSDYNKFKYTENHLSTDIHMLQLDRGMVVVRSFKNLQEARAYMNTVKNEPKLTVEYKSSEYEWVLISSGNFDKLMGEKEIYGYLKFYNAKYK